MDARAAQRISGFHAIRLSVNHTLLATDYTPKPVSTNYDFPHSGIHIVVYGVSGNTGKLIAESLHNRGISFTAAGRNAERVSAALGIVAQRAGATSATTAWVAR